MVSSLHVALSLVTLSGLAVAVFSLLVNSKKKPSTIQCNTKSSVKSKKKPESMQCNIKGKPSLEKPSSHCYADNKDMINELPDEILISIISHVPLKCAIRTSVLSKRWRNLYRRVSKIQLSCRDFLGPLSNRYFEGHDNLLIDSLNNFFRLHSGSQILVFELSCCFEQLSTDQFNSWFHSLVRLGIENIALNCGCDNGGGTLNFFLELLCDIHCLKYFKLSNCNLRPTLSSLQCNSLQILWLNGATIHPGAIECILSNCLNLHSLRIIGCKCPSKLCFRGGPHLRLTTLLVSYCKGVKDIKLYATNLVLFEFRSLEPVNFVFARVPKLNHMYHRISNKGSMNYVGGNFLKDLPHLKSLNFDARGYYFQEAIGFEGFINIFSNLSRLNLSIYLWPTVNLLFMAQLLQSCPLLEEFQLNKWFLISDAPNQRQEKRQPIVFHTQLKKMEITGFDGTNNEVEFALYILKCAISLETMHIYRCCKTYVGYAAWSNLVGNPWSEKTHRMIDTKLRGQAISKTAQVIIRHEAHVDSDSYRRAQDDWNLFF